MDKPRFDIESNLTILIATIVASVAGILFGLLLYANYG